MKIIRLKLDKCLQQRNISRYRLSIETGTHFSTIDGYYKNKIMRYDSYLLAKICSVLNCDINDLLECVEVEDDDGTQGDTSG